MSASSGRPAKRRSLTRNPTLDADVVCRLARDASKRQVKALWFNDGTLLFHLAKSHLDVFAKVLPGGNTHNGPTGRMTWGSLCSGSEGAHFVMQALQDALNAAEPTDSVQESTPLELEQLFACEMDREKREWIDLIVNTERRAGGRRCICIFGNICHMGEAKAWCHVHNRYCDVPDCNFVLVSTSCKDLSPLSNTKCPVPVLSLGHSPGGSADTFRLGLL